MKLHDITTGRKNWWTAEYALVHGYDTDDHNSPTVTITKAWVGTDGRPYGRGTIHTTADNDSEHEVIFYLDEFAETARQSRVVVEQELRIRLSREYPWTWGVWDEHFMPADARP